MQLQRQIPVPWDMGGDGGDTEMPYAEPEVEGPGGDQVEGEQTAGESGAGGAEHGPPPQIVERVVAAMSGLTITVSSGDATVLPRSGWFYRRVKQGARRETFRLRMADLIANPPTEDDED